MAQQELEPDPAIRRGQLIGAPRFLLYGLQSPINIGMILRLAETFRMGVLIYDQHGVLDDHDRLQTISDFACGALERVPPIVLRAAPAVWQTIGDCTLVATTLAADAIRLPDFDWRAAERMVIALGNEYDGLPDEVTGRATLRLMIPLPEGFHPKPASAHPIDPARTRPVAHEGQPNLNVAISAGVIAYDFSQSSQGRRASARA